MYDYNVIFRRYLKVWNGELLYYKPEDTLVTETCMYFLLYMYVWAPLPHERTP